MAEVEEEVQLWTEDNSNVSGWGNQVDLGTTGWDMPKNRFERWVLRCGGYRKVQFYNNIKCFE